MLNSENTCIINGHKIKWHFILFYMVIVKSFVVQFQLQLYSIFNKDI